MNVYQYNHKECLCSSSCSCTCTHCLWAWWWPAKIAEQTHVCTHHVYWTCTVHAHECTCVYCTFSNIIFSPMSAAILLMTIRSWVVILNCRPPVSVGHTIIHRHVHVPTCINIIINLNPQTCSGICMCSDGSANVLRNCSLIPRLSPTCSVDVWPLNL